MREAYYNEFDPKAAAWLRELIDNGHIAKGIVDERSISDVTPGDLEGYIQCHFFAGIGVWSKALRDAGWPDDRPVWTGSCPCQPFSAAGKGIGFADERHLWPAWHWLIDQCRPDTIFGEQVASKDGLNWFDLVSSDLEGSGYTVGASDLCAAGVGAPHIRQRLWFVAHADDARSQGRSRVSERPDQRLVGASGMAGGLAIDHCDGREPGRKIRPVQAQQDAQHGGPVVGVGHAERGIPGWRPGETSGAEGGGRRVEEPGYHRPVDAGTGAPLGVAYPDGWERLGLTDRQGRFGNGTPTGRVEGHGQLERDCGDHRPGPTNGHWRDADWLHGRDEKWRPVEPGTFPLAHGSPARVGRLRGYGNAIVKDAAQAFIEECMRCF